MWFQCGGQTKCVMGKVKIENINKRQIDDSSFSYRPKYPVLVGNEAPKGDQSGLRTKLF